MKKFKKLICGFLAVLLTFTSMPQVEMSRVYASSTLTLSTAKKLAEANSKDYRKIKSKIALTESKYVSAVKKTKTKVEEKTSFRWSFLLNFKLPESLNQTDEYEMATQPLEYETSISELQHQLADTIYSVDEEVKNLYTELYTLQSEITFYEERLEKLEDTYQRNLAGVAKGTATQSDCDSMKKSIDSLTTKLSNQQTSFEQDKQSMTDLIKLDVTSGYKFENPYIETSIDRDKLEYLEEFTLKNDQTYYEAKLTTQLKKMEVQSIYNLLHGEWGSKTNIIQKYINQAYNGQDIDTDAFKQDYDTMLTNADKPWNGIYIIPLFFFTIIFPKIFLKGSTDGTWYSEDDPYLLYTDVLEYLEAQTDEATAKTTTLKSVDTAFESMVALRKSYEELKSETESAKTAYDKAVLSNSLGTMTYTELSTTEEEYQDLQIQEIEALSDYTQSLYSLDRITCGAVTKLLNASGITLDAVGGGTSYVTDEDGNTVETSGDADYTPDIDALVGADSYLVEETYDGAYYYIKPYVEDSAFELTVYIPDDFSVEITDFELWCDGIQIGDRTSVDSKLWHLTLTTKNIEEAFIRLYNGDDVVDDVDIDASAASGELSIVGGYYIAKSESSTTLASYTTTNDTSLGITKLKITPESEYEDIKYYKLTASSNGSALLSDDYQDISSEFTYLLILSSDLENVSVEFFDESKTSIATGYFDTENNEIKKEGE